MIGLMGAMDEEIALLKDNVENLQSMEIAKMEYYTGNLMGQDIVLLKSGIGKVNATICAQILIDRFNVSQIIFTGLAGTLVPYLTVGDIVVSN
ncbi:MAG: 5'-methylthioadenosine/S-adenosylhomocysteine nucleosidase, partial [candidate division Zixibacteria bacterium]|nr:5'-methylthioadenosine/S-adenosylhomocysteine nucleosidase [candidate division Zixibacteria bacterium]